MAKYGGWTGKVLRVNLTTGKISSEDTIAKYKDFVGGEGLAFKVLWDEVPAGTLPHSAENKIIYGVGPLNGTGIPHANRLSITTLLQDSPFHGVGTGHAGGHWSSELKFAGWDSVIVEGKADHPVWICIQDDNVSIRDARKLWGNGIFQTTAAICDEMGAEAHVLAIGQAGENLMGSSTMLCDRACSAQGGSPMGYKNLKAIGVKGTGAIPLACTGKQLLEAINYHTSLIGGTSGQMKPQLPQPWAEFYGSGWSNDKKIFWGGADPPINTGECDPHDVHTYVFRGPTTRAGWNNNADRMRTLVRGAACFGCAVPCNAAVKVAQMQAKYGASQYVVNECGGLDTTRAYYAKFPDETSQWESVYMGSVLADDYGIGDDYHIMTGDFAYAVDKGLLKAALSEAEYKSIPWDLRDKGDPRFIADFLRRLAYREGELGLAMGLGSYELNKRWKFPPLKQQWQERPEGKAIAWNATTWFAPHHFEGQQIGAILNSMYNRDPTMHEQTHFNEISKDIDKSIFASLHGVESADAIDDEDQVTPINEAKIRLAVRLSADGVMHNSMTCCNRGGASFYSPLKERGYKGDSAMDAKEYSLVTGDTQTEDQFVQTGLRMFTLMRALTIRSMGTKDMRHGHDQFPDALFEHPDWKGKAAFSPGTQRMDRADMEKSLDMYYTALGWDKNTGAPTRAAYEKLGMKDVADQLDKLNLL